MRTPDTLHHVTQTPATIDAEGAAQQPRSQRRQLITAAAAGGAALIAAALPTAADGAAVMVQGAAGPTGPRGATGPTGPRGTTGATGATGAPGSSGAAGASGAPGASGPTGNTASDGVPGPTGPSAADFSLIFIATSDDPGVAPTIGSWELNVECPPGSAIIGMGTTLIPDDFTFHGSFVFDNGTPPPRYLVAYYEATGSPMIAGGTNFAICVQLAT